jgi:hypothetical protein
MNDSEAFLLYVAVSAVEGDIQAYIVTLVLISQEIPPPSTQEQIIYRTESKIQ